ncbi:hypothetical protein D9615_000939 [Tricholomella constricta]|uniref:Uncharacterized protein n=1 Tax=Tricholomella constricta TaxID=117010 RepID=A0A8H5HKX1_9AGAR|nr:hypothetical protein D9615_000939 [Tricholomella constricta]
MASQSILRAGVTSPARAFIRPGSKSILKRPVPLPLSPNPLPFAASFFVVVNSSHLSPHVHFPSSPAMVSMFSAYSPNTYDRAPIMVSPSSAGLTSWANRPLSPSAHNAFKLCDPPKRKSVAAVSPAPQKSHLAVPEFEDPRSPKPYKARTGVSFDELTMRPRRGAHGAEELSKALSTYPRSPYPSAPIEEDSDNTYDTELRGRGTNRTKNADKPQPPTRARSLENKSTKRRQNIGMHMASPLKQSFLSPVREAPRVVVTKPAPLDLEGDSLSQAFWQSVSLEEEPESAYMTANEMPEGLKSPAPGIMFGDRDGSLWSPRMPKKDMHRDLRAGMSVLSPAQRIAFSKGIIASPSPNDPFAAFPSFSIALASGMDGVITYPPRAMVEQGGS